MKTLATHYTFNKTSRQITFTGELTFNIEQLLLITNVTSNVIIYNFANPSLGGTITNNVLTLDYNTTTMADTDKLQIFVDIPNTQDLESLATVLSMGFEELLHMLQSMKTSQGLPDPAARVRVNMETGGTLSTVTTVSNITSQGGFQAPLATFEMSNQGWASLRNKISVS